MNLQPFTPAGATVNLAVTSSSGRVALTQAPASSAELTVVLRNAGDADVFVAFGSSTVTATTASGMPVPAGTTMVYSVSVNYTHVAAITASGTATIYATSGSGLPYGFGAGQPGGAGGEDVNIVAVAGTTVVPGTAPIPVGFYNPTGGALLDPTAAAEVVGNVASGATDSGKPVKTGAKYNTTLPTYTNGQRTETQADVNGNQRMLLVATPINPSDGLGNTSIQSVLNQNDNAGGGTKALYVAHAVYNGSTWDRVRGNTTGTIMIPPQGWSYAAASGGIVNTTTAVTIKTAAGASVRNYLQSLNISTDALGGATELAVRDGAGGTVLTRIKLQTTALTATQITFNPPIYSTANTLLEVVTLTNVTGGVFVNATGYTAP